MLPEVAELRRSKMSDPFTGPRSSAQRGWSLKGPASPVRTEMGDCSPEKPEPSSRWSIESDNTRLLPYPRTAYISPVKKKTATQPIRFLWRKDGRPFFASKLPGKASPGTAMGTAQTSPLFLYNPVTIQPYEKLKTLPFVSSE
ncbi:hypothetical protein FRC00_000350 [Tulasnella sp. 408]|nr:hypothetical protein FRC00_000350 [Tulasnella sp. 408]